MEIKNPNAATLSNFEVMIHLQSINKDRKNKSKGHLATITYETSKYLDHSPCAKQSSQAIKDCTKALEPYNLNKNEKLMIINNPPKNALEIQLIVDESEERLSEEQVEEILQIVAQYLNINSDNSDKEEILQD